MQKTEIRDFTHGNIMRQLLVFSWPLFLSNMLQVVYNMVDMIIVGNRYGKIGLSAVSVGGDVTNFLTFLAIGFANAGQVIIAKYIGEGRRDKLSRFVGTMSAFLFACAAALSVLGLVFRTPILALMNTPDAAFAGAMEYSTVCMAGLVFIYGYNIVSAVLRGMGDSKHPFIFISIAAVMNLVLDVVFIYVFDMGPYGAALATVISQGISFVCCTIFLFRHRERFELKFEPCDFTKWDGEMLSDLIKLGTPMAIKSASVQFSKLFVNSWINSYGTAVSGFAGIANKIASISNLVSAAMNTAGSTMMGQNLAARKYDRAVGIMCALAKVTLSAATVISLVIVIFPSQVFRIFTSDAEVLALGGKYVPIAVLLFFGAACRAIMNALINGSGNYRVNFATAILDGIVMRIGLALLFGLALGMKHYGFWLGDALAGFTPFWVGLIFYFSGKWKKEE
ncbi:MAG: MATE family efflux transporter [Oscillospiraceae bacterium]|nr:MATE family efflux transporter [Oscillospiraceae bacterium]